MKRIAAPAVAATLALLAVAPGAGASASMTSVVKPQKVSSTSCTRLPALIPICRTASSRAADSGKCGYRVVLIPICRQQ